VKNLAQEYQGEIPKERESIVVDIGSISEFAHICEVNELLEAKTLTFVPGKGNHSISVRRKP